MRVVFVDIDGVLNSDRLFAEHPSPEGASWWSADAIDPSAVALLEALLERTGAVVVLSSSWRKRATLDELRAMLRTRGLSIPVFAATPSLYRSPEGVRPTRGDEILAWLAAESARGARVERWVVLEDEEELGEVEARCVRTDARVGLTASDVERAVRMLEG